MNLQRRFLLILFGPIVFVIVSFLLSGIFSSAAAQAVGVMAWMIVWWITRPVNITVTAILPVAMNAVLNLVPMETVTAQYASDSVILIFGSGLITMPWSNIGLDRRIALKTLSMVGPSMKSQIIVWLLASVLLSTVLPNVAVCALFSTIAVSMLHAAGHGDIPNSAPAVPILMAVGWGVTLGGAGSPLGGAMNLVAISFMEDYTGHEFIYIDWVVRILPYFVIAVAALLIGMLLMPSKVKYLEGTKAFFEEEYRALGPMKRDEKICAALFLVALAGVFLRPLYDHFLPGLTPAYIFLIIGFLTFFITAADKGLMLTWEQAQKDTMWGMMILFAGGMALGSLLNGAGASARVAELVSGMSLDGGLMTIIILVVFTRILSELTNGTTAAAIMVPIVFSFTAEMNLNPVPYWFITTMAFNGEYLLPISVRAIPVAHGLNANRMLKAGIPMTLINMVIVIETGWTLMKFWTAFSTFSYL